MKKGIMLLGTASSVGKSTIAAAFCRHFKKKGYNVAPYKALNISLNSYVTSEGDEIGRAQVVQAEACEIEPREYMNPILIKPSTKGSTQVIVRGKVYCTMDLYKYEELNKLLKEKAKEAYEDISNYHDLIILEGSGSCAEINLRETDIANMQTAEMSDSDVILVADIDRGGVFASIVGTLALLREDERARVKGVIINKFRGSKKFFEPAMKQLEDIINIPILGVMPYFKLKIEDEDSMEVKNFESNDGIKVVVLKLPYMSNFTDFDAIGRLDSIDLKYVESTKELKGAKLIIIPGSKNTIEDLKFIKENGFKEALEENLKEGSKLLGICGGYQILGKIIKDPLGVEGPVYEEEGLGLLNIETTFNKEKYTRRVEALTSDFKKVYGYEIHNGESVPLDKNEVWIRDKGGKVLGTKNKEGNVYGTYIHGIFDEGDFLREFIDILDEKLKINNIINYKDFKKEQYDELERLLRENIDMDFVERLILNI